MAVLLVVVVLVIQLALGIALGMLDLVAERVLHVGPPGLGHQPLAIGCANIAATGGAIALGLLLNRLALCRAFPLGQLRGAQLVGMAVTVIGASVLISEVDNALRWLWPPPKWILSLLQQLLFEGGLLSRVFLLVIVAPITEELLFRGIILRGLLNRYCPRLAVALTAFLFAVLHLNPWQSVSALILGLVFGWFYVRTGSVLLCVLAHALANGLCLVFTLLPFDIPGMTGGPDYSRVAFQPWWLDLSGVGVLAAGLWLFHKAAPDSVEPAQPGPPPLPLAT